MYFTTLSCFILTLLYPSLVAWVLHTFLFILLLYICYRRFFIICTTIDRTEVYDPFDIGNLFNDYWKTFEEPKGNERCKCNFSLVLLNLIWFLIEFEFSFGYFIIFFKRFYVVHFILCTFNS